MPVLNYNYNVPSSAAEGDTLSLRGALLATHNRAFQGLLRPPSTSNNRSSSTVIEESFRNFTISLMSTPDLQYVSARVLQITIASDCKHEANRSRIDPANDLAPAVVNVTMPTFHTVYAYAASKLIGSYSAVIVATAICVALGSYATIRNQTGFHDRLSTFFRIFQAAKLTTGFSGLEMDRWKERLPADLSKVRIALPRTFSEKRESTIYNDKGHPTEMMALTARSKEAA